MAMGLVNMKISCEDCVHLKLYPRSGYWCMGVTLVGGKTKRTELLTDLGKVQDCEFYDDDSWIK